MPITIICPSCGVQAYFPRHLAGHEGMCPGCARSLAIPGTPDQESSAPPAPGPQAGPVSPVSPDGLTDRRPAESSAGSTAAATAALDLPAAGPGDSTLARRLDDLETQVRGLKRIVVILVLVVAVLAAVAGVAGVLASRGSREKADPLPNQPVQPF